MQNEVPLIRGYVDSVTEGKQIISVANKSRYF